MSDLSLFQKALLDDCFAIDETVENVVFGLLFDSSTPLVITVPSPTQRWENIEVSTNTSSAFLIQMNDSNTDWLTFTFYTLKCTEISNNIATVSNCKASNWSIRASTSLCRCLSSCHRPEPSHLQAAGTAADHQAPAVNNISDNGFTRFLQVFYSYIDWLFKSRQDNFPDVIEKQ